MWNDRGLNIKFFLKTKPVVTYTIAIVTVIFYFITTYISEDLYAAWLNDSVQVIYHKEYYRTFTALFMHGGIAHLLMNLLVLVPLGQMLELEMGRVVWAMLYFCTGIISNYVTDLYYFKQGELHRSLGCSGAVYGMLGALLLLVILYHGHYAGVTIQRMGFVILILVLSVYRSESEVDVMAHAFGFIAGFAMMIIPGVFRQRQEMK